MSETVNRNLKHRFSGHPHHLFKIPAAYITTHESMDEEDGQTMTTDVESSDDNAARRSILDKYTAMFRKPMAYKVFFLVQSSHFIMALAVCLVVSSLIPGGLWNTSNANSNDEKVKPRTLVNFVYLASFSMHLGSQFWMTIVSGLSLYFNLSRHAFGDVQKILFPKYFSINSMLSAITLIQFGKIHVTRNLWDLQLIALSLCFLLELTIWLYVVPPVLRLIAAKTAIEKAVGLGKEVGRCNLGRLVDCPHYMTMHKLFRKVHMFMAIGNVITIVCSVFHLAHIAC